MRTCRVCHKPIEHLNGNQEICDSCQPKGKVNIKRKEPVVPVKISDFSRLERQAKLGSKIERLPDDLKAKVFEMLKV